MTFFRKFWHRGKKSRKSAFGGIIKSDEEVKELNKKIVDYETKEFQKFEEQFDEQLKKM